MTSLIAAYPVGFAIILISGIVHAAVVARASRRRFLREGRHFVRRGQANDAV